MSWETLDRLLHLQFVILQDPTACASWEPGFAWEWTTSGTSEEKYGVVARIKTRADKFGKLAVEEFTSASREEREILLGPGLKFKVIGAKKYERAGKKFVFLDLEEVDPSTPLVEGKTAYL